MLAGDLEKFHESFTQHDSGEEWCLRQTDDKAAYAEAHPTAEEVSQAHQYPGVWTYLVIAGIQIVAALQASIMQGRNLLGFVFANYRFPGSWPTRYPT